MMVDYVAGYLFECETNEKSSDVKIRQISVAFASDILL